MRPAGTQARQAGRRPGGQAASQLIIMMARGSAAARCLHEDQAQEDSNWRCWARTSGDDPLHGAREASHPQLQAAAQPPCSAGQRSAVSLRCAHATQHPLCIAGRLCSASTTAPPSPYAVRSIPPPLLRHCAVVHTSSWNRAASCTTGTLSFYHLPFPSQPLAVPQCASLRCALRGSCGHVPALMPPSPCHTDAPGAFPHAMLSGAGPLVCTKSCTIQRRPTLWHF